MAYTLPERFEARSGLPCVNAFVSCIVTTPACRSRWNYVAITELGLKHFKTL